MHEENPTHRQYNDKYINNKIQTSSIQQSTIKQMALLKRRILFQVDRNKSGIHHLETQLKSR